MFGNESLAYGVEQVARVLLARGSSREALAMLRGAIARDRREEGCARLLAELEAVETPLGKAPDVPLDLTLVDLWIRRGMLVEALALLGGTPMGSEDTGREWANLLGELLAPVPVDADKTLEETHRQLLSGGASVALTLLEEHERKEPKLPAWAARRLEVLRWMLLDNAKAAVRRPAPEGEVPSLLAGALRAPIHQRNMPGALEAAEAFANEHPSNKDAARTTKALRRIMEEVGRLAVEAAEHNRTIPVVGHNAALMQLRMGNLKHATSVYTKILRKKPHDERAQAMILEIETLGRALRGDPVVVDLFGEDTFTADDEDPPTDRVNTAARTRAKPAPAHRTVTDGKPFGARTEGKPRVEPRTVTDARPLPSEELDVDIPQTKITRLPDEEDSTEQSGARRAVAAPPEEDTRETPRAQDEAERLAQVGRLEEAENIYRGLASLNPGRPELLRRAEELRSRRLLASGSGPVLVHSIKPIK